MNKQEFLNFIEQHWTTSTPENDRFKLVDFAKQLFGNDELLDKIINFSSNQKYRETIDQILQNQTDESSESIPLLIAGLVHEQMCEFDPLFPVFPMNGPVGLVTCEYIDNGEISIKSNAIEARKYPLHSRFRIESMCDLQQIHGNDVVHSVAKLMADEIVRENIRFLFSEISRVGTHIICNNDNDLSRLLRIIADQVGEYKTTFNEPELNIFLPHHLVQDISSCIDTNALNDVKKVSMRGLTALDQFNISRNKLTGHVFNLVVGGVTVFVYATDYLPMNKFIMSHGSKLSAGCYYAPYKTIVGFTNDNNVANPQLSTRFGIHVRKTDKQYYTIFELKTS